MKKGLFPHELKHVDIIPINKKKDKYNKENYCPLSILRNLSKNVKNVCTINQSINQSINHFFITSKQFPRRAQLRTVLSTAFWLQFIDP